MRPAARASWRSLIVASWRLMPWSVSWQTGSTSSARTNGCGAAARRATDFAVGGALVQPARRSGTQSTTNHSRPDGLRDPNAMLDRGSLRHLKNLASRPPVSRREPDDFDPQA